MQIPFHKPYRGGREIEYISQVLEAGNWGGAGRFTRDVASKMSRVLDASPVYLTVSATAGLEMAALLARITPGQEVIMPSFTFTSTANAFLLRGAHPVFAEIKPQDMNMEVSDIPCRLSGHSRVVVPVHYAGVPCAMDEICALAREQNMLVIEDAAQAFGASYLGKPAGNWGQFGVFSFHVTKNLSSGEGGALIVNDKEARERAEIIWQKGTDRERFMHNEIALYQWQDIGSSFAPSEILVALLKAQLEAQDEVLARRRERWERYYRELVLLEKRERLRLPQIDHRAQSSYHIFHILLPSPMAREKLQNGLAQAGVQALTHYVPLHLSPMGRRLGYQPGDLPQTERLADTLLRLPLYPGLTEGEQGYVIEQIYRLLD